MKLHTIRAMAKSFQISYTEPFSYEKCFNALYRSEDEILYRLEHQRIYRLINVGGNYITLVISESADHILVETEHEMKETEISYLTHYVQNWFDLNKDLTPFYQLLQKDNRLAHLPEQLHGLRIVGIPDVFEAICWSIIGQQINLTFAHKLKRRLVEHYGTKVQWNGIELHHFPSPEAMMEIDEVYLHSTQQFSRSKLKYLKNVAEAFSSGEISRKKLLSLPTFEERQNLLTSIKGIGVWSANYTLMKALNQPEAVPYGDTGLSQALFNLGIIDDRKDIKSMERFFEDFSGWEAYLVFYLWSSL
ncbi:DNA-3-methyladenine glycosylase family protein [Roseivirga spongicola]|nr:DNA-3-methyladenine glycosylase [Roseivirga spongicola]WPZ10324.1 DNA glycosylase [Roseivirga spongicola]